MTIKVEHFEQGALGAAVNATSTSFNTTAGADTGTITFSDTKSMSGKAAKFDIAGNAGKSLVWAYPAGNSINSVSIRAYFYLPAGRSTHTTIIYTSFGTDVPVYVFADGTIRIDASVVLHQSAAGAWKDERWMRVELVVIKGTTTSNGTVKFAVYEGENTTPVTTFTTTTANTGTGSLVNVQFGRPYSGAISPFTFYVDNAVAIDGRTDFIGRSGEVGQWSYWNGASEQAVTFQGVWDGDSLESGTFERTPGRVIATFDSDTEGFANQNAPGTVAATVSYSTAVKRPGHKGSLKIVAPRPAETINGNPQSYIYAPVPNSPKAVSSYGVNLSMWVYMEPTTVGGNHYIRFSVLQSQYQPLSLGYPVRQIVPGWNLIQWTVDPSDLRDLWAFGLWVETWGVVSTGELVVYISDYWQNPNPV